MSLLLERTEPALTTRIFRKIEDIDASEWDQVFPEALEGYRFFKALDESGFDQFSFYYIMIFEDGRPAGAAPCFFMNYPLGTTVRGPFKRLFPFFQKVLPDFFNLKALICGLPMDQGRIGIKSGNPRAVLDEIIRCMDRIARDEGAGIVAFKDFGSEYAGLVDPIQSQGFYKFADLPSTDMEIPFASLEEYMKTLSRVSRDGLKRKLKKVAGLRLELEITRRMHPEVLAEAYGLYRQTEEHGEVQFERVPEKFFDAVARNMPEETRFFLWRMDGKLVAFAHGLVSGEHFIDLYLGLDYSLAYEHHLYFIRFRDLMNWCLGQRIKKYEMGPTGYEAKRRLGFKMIPLNIYVKHRTPWINSLLKLLCMALKPENFHEVLKDMKKGSAECIKTK